MRKGKITDTIDLMPEDPQRVLSLCGPMDDNLLQIERRMNVSISYDKGSFEITGNIAGVGATKAILRKLYVDTAAVKGKYPDITREQVNLAIVECGTLEQESDAQEVSDDAGPSDGTIRTKKGIVRPRTPNQAAYVAAIAKHDITFGIGPAGSGKTYLAVAAAVNALERQEIRRILLTRPAVEAGEKLGYLPGDLSQKVDPYLRPLYDALFEMLGFDRVEKLVERQVIEIAPLAYMRGRTLNDAFVILDESQNTTVEQMKMFLTRIGFNSKAVITGDITQIDLPRHQTSGLKHAIEVLKGVSGLSFNFFESRDIVRHPVVARIVEAYAKWDDAQKAKEAEAKAAREVLKNER